MRKSDRGPDWDDWDEISDSVDRKRRVSKERRFEEHAHGFGCSHCSLWIPLNETMGTHNRNHCPSCLWSRHMDDRTPGDRKSECRANMKPIALTFKGESRDKYAEMSGSSANRLGELMLVHECVMDDQIRINRIAADDNPSALMAILRDSIALPALTKELLIVEGIKIATPDMHNVVRTMLGYTT